MNFEHINHKGLSYYRCSQLYTQGIEHGFCDASLNFNKQERDSSVRKFCEIFGVTGLKLLNQQHTDRFVIVKDESFNTNGIEADAFIFENYKVLKGEVFGIITADCLPIILYTGESLALIHSGWKGLANGIISKTLDALCGLARIEKLSVIIGPAAGENQYEVGEEVLEQIGKNAVYKKGRPGKYFFSLIGTAEAIIKSKYSADVNFFSSGICVISNQNFFSHRREGGSGGRNLSFLKF